MAPRSKLSRKRRNVATQSTINSDTLHSGGEIVDEKDISTKSSKSKKPRKKIATDQNESVSNVDEIKLSGNGENEDESSDCAIFNFEGFIQSALCCQWCSRNFCSLQIKSYVLQLKPCDHLVCFYCINSFLVSCYQRFLCYNNFSLKDIKCAKCKERKESDRRILFICSNRMLANIVSNLTDKGCLTSSWGNEESVDIVSCHGDNNEQSDVEMMLLRMKMLNNFAVTKKSLKHYTTATASTFDLKLVLPSSSSEFFTTMNLDDLLDLGDAVPSSNDNARIFQPSGFFSSSSSRNLSSSASATIPSSSSTTTEVPNSTDISASRLTRNAFGSYIENLDFFSSFYSFSNIFSSRL